MAAAIFTALSRLKEEQRVRFDRNYLYLNSGSNAIVPKTVFLQDWITHGKNGSRERGLVSLRRWLKKESKDAMTAMLLGDEPYPLTARAPLKLSKHEKRNGREFRNTRTFVIENGCIINQETGHTVLFENAQQFEDLKDKEWERRIRPRVTSSGFDEQWNDDPAEATWGVEGDGSLEHEQGPAERSARGSDSFMPGAPRGIPAAWNVMGGHQEQESPAYVTAALHGFIGSLTETRKTVLRAYWRRLKANPDIKKVTAAELAQDLGLEIGHIDVEMSRIRKEARKSPALVGAFRQRPSADTFNNVPRRRSRATRQIGADMVMAPVPSASTLADKYRAYKTKRWRAVQANIPSHSSLLERVDGDWRNKFRGFPEDDGYYLGKNGFLRGSCAPSPASQEPESIKPVKNPAGEIVFNAWKVKEQIYLRDLDGIVYHLMKAPGHKRGSATKGGERWYHRLISGALEYDDILRRRKLLAPVEQYDEDDDGDEEGEAS